MKKTPGPLAPPDRRRPNLSIEVIMAMLSLTSLTDVAPALGPEPLKSKLVHYLNFAYQKSALQNLKHNSILIYPSQYFDHKIH